MSKTEKEKLRDKVNEDIEKFLKKGGKVKQIPTGVSGMDTSGRAIKHILIEKKDAIKRD